MSQFTIFAAFLICYGSLISQAQGYAQISNGGTGFVKRSPAPADTESDLESDLAESLMSGSRRKRSCTCTCEQVDAGAGGGLENRQGRFRNNPSYLRNVQRVGSPGYNRYATSNFGRLRG